MYIHIYDTYACHINNAHINHTHVYKGVFYTCNRHICLLVCKIFWFRKRKMNSVAK